MPESEHKCLHETDFALMAKTQTDMSESVKELVDLIKGSNGHGLLTRLALNDQSLTRLWWWVGGISTTILVVGVSGVLK